MERAITQCVQRFCEKARKDPVLGPMFSSGVDNSEGRIDIVRDFWSQVLLGADRYKSQPFPPNHALGLRRDHFRCWLDLFKETARETLPAAVAEEAIAKAARVSDSFQAKLFSVVSRQNIRVCRPA
jgi:hemoglobin